MDKLSISGSDSSNEKESHLSRPNSNPKLEKIELNIQKAMRKSEENKSGDELSKRLGDFCLQAVDSIKNCSNLIENHKENLAFAKEDTEHIAETVKGVANIEKRMKRSANLHSPENDLPEDNFDFVNKILKEEAEFQAKYNKNGKKKEPAVASNDKQKLLATLRAIDNGDSFDSFESESKQDKQLMKELFGDLSN